MTTPIDFYSRRLAASNAENAKRARTLIDGDNVVSDYVKRHLAQIAEWSPEQQARAWELFWHAMDEVGV